MKKILLTALLAVAAVTLQGQTSISTLTKLTIEDYMSLEIPSLETLLENAKNNPTVRYYDLQTEGERCELKTVRRDWLNYIKLNGSYQYGRMNDISSQYGIDNPLYNIYNSKLQNLYSVGASLSIPLGQVFNRRNKIKQQKLRIEETEQQVERWHDEQSLKIIDAYTSAIQNLSLLRIKAEAVAVAQAQYKISETDFVNGKLDAQTLSRQKNIESSTLTEYEQTKAQLNNALLRLEVLSRTKLISK